MQKVNSLCTDSRALRAEYCIVVIPHNTVGFNNSRWLKPAPQKIISFLVTDLSLREIFFFFFNTVLPHLPLTIPLAAGTGRAFSRVCLFVRALTQMSKVTVTKTVTVARFLVTCCWRGSAFQYDFLCLQVPSTSVVAVQCLAQAPNLSSLIQPYLC